MKIWNERPFEIRNLFNPSFCGLILLRSLKGYEEDDEAGMPFSLSLLVLPLCLHKETRDIINGNRRSYLLKVITDNQNILVNLPKRTKDLLGYTFEGLGFAMHNHGFKVEENGRLLLNKKIIKSKFIGTEESIDCQKAARIIGRQFARINDRVTIYTSLGVKP